MSRSKWAGIAGMLAGAAAIGSALTGIYMDWKEHRAVEEIRKAKYEIMNDQHEQFAKMIANNNALFENAVRWNEERGS